MSEQTNIKIGGRLKRTFDPLVRRVSAFFYGAYENIPCRIQIGCRRCGESGEDGFDPDFNCVDCEGTGVVTQHARLSSNGVRLLRLSGFWIKKYVTPNKKITFDSAKPAKASE